MVRNEGAMSLYRGTVAPLLGNMALLGIHFPVFSAVRKRLDAVVRERQGGQGRARPGGCPSVCPPAAAGLLACTLDRPPERPRLPPAPAQNPTPVDDFSAWKVLASGGAAGLAGSLVSCPSEHIRTKMQLQRRAALAASMGLPTQVRLVTCCSLCACILPPSACRAPPAG